MSEASHNHSERSDGAEFDQSFSFTSEIAAQPNVDRLLLYADSADSGATLLGHILSEVGLTETMAQIAHHRSAIESSNQEWQKFISKKEEPSDEDIEAKREQLLESQNQHLESVSRWETVNHKIEQANAYYKWRVQVGNGRFESNELTDLYDKTDQFNDSPILKLIYDLRDQLPPPRKDGRGVKLPSVAEKNRIEADRLARLLILEEHGEISFDEV